MNELYLIRHGKASLDGSERDRGLTEEGHEQAIQIMDIFKNFNQKITKIYSSPLNRAILTITPLSNYLNLEIHVVEDLKEKITGDTSGKNLNDEKQKMWTDFDSKLPGGESSKEATDRAVNALNVMANELENNEHAVVQCHGTLIGLILHHFDSTFGFSDWKKMTMPDIYKLVYDNNTVVIEHIGCDSIETFKIGD
jgi:2,3-bisphosphoglycerate-dependent phosphoglycerate mutase|tara:strand:- start:22 stop:609 length:588 start_codon:yes stop_codon:yes gene_type:complete